MLLAGLALTACGEVNLNRPPVLGSVAASPAVVNPGEAVTVSVAATDPDGNPLTYAWTLPPGWTAIGDTTAATVALTAPAAFAQAATVLVTVSDNQGGSTSGQAVVSTAAGTAPSFKVLGASPNPVAPGGTVTLAATAISAVGSAVTYQWTSSDPAWTLTATAGTAVLTAPAIYGAATSILVTADDGNGLTGTGQILVQTLAPGTLDISGLTAAPSTVAPGGAITVTAAVSNPSGLALQYAWTVADPIWTVAGSGATATVTAPAQISKSTVVTLTVTDQANASVSRAVAVATAGTQAPVAVIAGTPPIVGAVNARVALDGSGSHSPVGNPIDLTWTVVNAPPGAGYQLVDAAGADASHSVSAFLVGDRPGLYGIQLSAFDPNTSLAGYATTQVRLMPWATIAVVSGDAQSGTVVQDLPNPIVIEVRTSDDQPVPHVALGWNVANGTGFGASAQTDALGQARIVVRPGSIAGAGTVRVWLTDDRAVTKTMTFTGTAGPAASIAVKGGVGTVVDGVTVTVEVVDAFGNLALDNTAANTAPFRLRVTSPSGKARLVPPGSSPTTLLTGNLTAGTFSVPLTDSAAEHVTIEIDRLTAAIGLPFAGWYVAAHDDLEAGVRTDFWRTTTGTAGAGARWQPVTGAAKVHAGTGALGLEQASSEVVSAGTNIAFFTSDRSPYVSGRPTRAEVFHKLQYGASAPLDDCTGQPAFQILAYEPFTGATSLAAPVGGYPVLDACDNGRSLAPTTGWAALQVDLTGTYSSLAFKVVNGSQAALSPATASSWYLDDIRISALQAPSFSSAAANARINAGPPAKLIVQAAVADYAACASGAPTTIEASVSLVDASGNPTQDSVSVYRLGWNGSAVATHVEAGALAADATRQVDLKLDYGRAQIRLADTALEAVHFTVGNPHGYPGVDVTSTADVVMPAASTLWQCHAVHFANGSVAAYSDVNTIGAPPYPQAAALRACERAVSGDREELTGPCSVISDLPNTVMSTYLVNYDWYYGETYQVAPYYFAYGGGTAPDGHRLCKPLVSATAACTPNGWACPVYNAGQAFSGFDATCTNVNGQCPSTRADERCAAWSFSLPGGLASATWP
jgi:hypothetical protein